jgi:hypothetical protein
MFAPEGAVTFREGTQGMTATELVLEDELRTVVNGRRTIWLSLAVFDEATGEWTYRGDESTIDRCIGWNVLVEWYDAEGKVIVRDSFRVNIANEECFDSVVPLYREGLANKEFVKEQIAAIEHPQYDDSEIKEQVQEAMEAVRVLEQYKQELEIARAEIAALKETKDQLLASTYGVEYEWLYIVDQDAIDDVIPFNQENAPGFYEDWLPVLESGDDALIEEFVAKMYEEDIYRMYAMKLADEHKLYNRYEMFPLDGHEMQPENEFMPKWAPVKSVTCWNWSGEEDGGFTLDSYTTSKMTFAFIKVKEEYRGKF